MSIDFDLAPSTTDPETTPSVPPVTDAPQAAPVATQPASGRRAVAHTEGGLPALPLLVIGGNTAVAGLSATALAAGPTAALALAAGTTVTAAAASVRTRVKSRTPRRAAPRRTPTSTRTNNASRAGTGSTGSRAGGRTAAAKKSPAAGGGSGTAKKPTPASSKAGAGTGTGSRAGQIRELRKDRAAQSGTRKESREKDTAARRGVADARRAAKAAAKADRKQAKDTARTRPADGRKTTGAADRAGATKTITPGGKSTGPGKHGTKTTPKTTSLPKRVSEKAAGAKAVETVRTAADDRTRTRTERIRAARTAAKARAVMVRKTTGAQARYGMSALKAGVIAAPFAALGLITTPIGRRFGWRWLMYPGPRVYQRLTATAKQQRAARFADAKDAYTKTINPEPEPETTETDDATEGAEPIADTVPRAPRTGATPDITGDEPMSEEIHTHFTEASEQLVAAAHAYEPGGMMHVRMTIRSMGPAIEQWGAAFATLATKTDDDFPLEKEIGEGMEEIHLALMRISDMADELSQTFDRLHEADIKRITEPRKSHEAEKGWDVTNNEDYDGE